MKDYPSIPGSKGSQFREIPNCHVFDKLDGSSMRSEWNRKSGWYKHGRRRGLLDDSNPQLVQVPELFMSTLAEPLEKVARDQRWQSLVVFYEFWGEKSLAGQHYADDPKKLTLFDAVPDKKGFLPPRLFREKFEDAVPTAKCLGIVNWTRGFVEQVRLGQVEGVTFEGVVGKAGASTHEIVRAKAKTQAWIDRVVQLHGLEKGAKLVDS